MTVADPPDLRDRYICTGRTLILSPTLFALFCILSHHPTPSPDSFHNNHSECPCFLACPPQKVTGTHEVLVFARWDKRVEMSPQLRLGGSITTASLATAATTARTSTGRSGIYITLLSQISSRQN